MTDTTRPEWGLVTVTEDLSAEAARLGQLADDFEHEARNWPHPSAQSHLALAASDIRELAQVAAMAAMTGDYWSRWNALQTALEQRRAGAQLLREWWQKGELWNSHRMRPIPASIQAAL
jgi:hypothetical protein